MSMFPPIQRCPTILSCHFSSKAVTAPPINSATMPQGCFQQISCQRLDLLGVYCHWSLRLQGTAGWKDGLRWWICSVFLKDILWELEDWQPDGTAVCNSHDFFIFGHVAAALRNPASTGRWNARSLIQVGHSYFLWTGSMHLGSSFSHGDLLPVPSFSSKMKVVIAITAVKAIGLEVEACYRSISGRKLLVATRWLSFIESLWLEPSQVSLPFDYMYCVVVLPESRYPLDRARHAEVLNQLNKANPETLGKPAD